MNHLLTRVLVATAAAGVVLAAQAGPAAADPTSWKWGSIHSTDGMATARGKVVVGQSGLAVTGHLDDTRGRGCSWLLVKYQSASNGRWRTHGIYNCVPGTGTFRKNVGGPLQIRAQVCRGTSQRPVGKCSRWRTIYTQGG